MMPTPRLRAAGALSLLSLLSLLAGCSAVGPDYKRPELPLPKTWNTEIADAADVVDTAWWQAFGDARLNALIAEALANNKDLRIAVHRVAEYEARLQIAGAQGKPQVGYSFNGTRQRRSEEQPAQFANLQGAEFNGFATALNFSWEVDLWGRIKRANEAALAELLSAQATQRGVMLTMVTGLATNYVQLLGLDKELATARETVKNREATLATTEAKAKGGSATQVLVERARADVEAAQAVIPDLERRIGAAESALSLLAGRNPGPVARGTLDALGKPKVPQGLPSDLLSRRPDVAAAEQTLIAANANIGVAKGEYFPTISVTGALGLASDDLRWLWSKTARTGDFTRGLVGTLFSAGRIEGGVLQAEAVQRQMAETYAKAMQTGLQEVEDALLSRVKAGEQGAAVDRQVKALQEAARLTRLRYEGGQSTLIDVLNAEREVITAQNAQAQTQRDQFVALVAIYKAMGGGWMEEQNQIRSAKATAAAPSATP